MKSAICLACSPSPARALLGYGGDWPGADSNVVNAFLAGLRDSSISLKQQAYFALHDMVLGSFTPSRPPGPRLAIPALPSWRDPPAAIPPYKANADVR